MCKQHQKTRIEAYPYLSLFFFPFFLEINANPKLNTPAETANQVADATPAIAFAPRALVPELPARPDLPIVLLGDAWLRGACSGRER